MMKIEPYGSGVSAAGPEAPKCEHIDELIKLLVTIRKRWGNTDIKYRISWGGLALCVEDAEKTEIDRLTKLVAKKNKQLKRLKESAQ
jgi:hypothetical protein